VRDGTRRCGRGRLVGVLAVVGLLGTAASALASHQFSDVPTAAIYHDAAEWLANRGVTLGCATGLYCPNEFVTRGQMALFMQRLGAALTPVRIWQIASDFVDLDLDALPVVCATTSDHVPTFPQRAVIRGQVSVRAHGAADYRALAAVSTNGGLSWSLASSSSQDIARSPGPPGFYPLAINGSHDLATGTFYRFALRLERPSADTTADIDEYTCSIFVEVVNRNPTSAPFGSGSRVRGR
jgi:hypothetical protein